MINFVFMLTHNDAIVPEALDVLEQLRGTGLRYVGFKDVGATVPQLTAVCAAAHEQGLKVMLEVVSTSTEDERRSLEAAGSIGVDWVLGGTDAASGAKLLGGTVRYCPFPGRVVGHPSVLEGTIEEIAEDARRITALDGVDGLDLLAYRHPTVDVEDLDPGGRPGQRRPGDRGRLGDELRPDRGALTRRRVGLHDRWCHLRGPVPRRPRCRRPGPGRSRRLGLTLVAGPVAAAAPRATSTAVPAREDDVVPGAAVDRVAAQTAVDDVVPSLPVSDGSGYATRTSHGTKGRRCPGSGRSFLPTAAPDRRHDRIVIRHDLREWATTPSWMSLDFVWTNRPRLRMAPRSGRHTSRFR